MQNTQRKPATWRTKAALTIGLTAVAALAPSPADAAYTCAIGFDSYWSLAALPKKACDTFAPNYTQACGTDSYTFTPSKYGHFHLAHQNRCYGACLASDGCMGVDKACLGTGTGCGIIGDHATQPRYAASHTSDEVVTFVGAPNPGSYCLNGGCVSTSGKIFTPTNIQVLGQTPVRIDIWVIKSRIVNGKSVPYKEQRYWASIGPGSWNLGNEGLIDKLTITAADQQAGRSFSFDGLKIAVN